MSRPLYTLTRNRQKIEGHSSKILVCCRVLQAIPVLKRIGDSGQRRGLKINLQRVKTSGHLRADREC